MRQVIDAKDLIVALRRCGMIEGCPLVMHAGIIHQDINSLKSLLNQVTSTSDGSEIIKVGNNGFDI